MKFKYRVLAAAVLVASLMALLMIPVLAADNYRLTSNPATLVTSGASGWYAGITNNTSCTGSNATLYVGGADWVCVQFHGALHDSGTTAGSVSLQQSADGNYWVSMGGLAYTPAGATAVTAITNMQIKGAQYIKVSAINNDNANTGALTNYSVVVHQK